MEDLLILDEWINSASLTPVPTGQRASTPIKREAEESHQTTLPSLPAPEERATQDATDALPPREIEVGDLSPAFLEARREAMILGFEGSELRRYIIDRVGTLNAGNGGQSASPHPPGPQVRLEKWNLKDEPFESFHHRFERLANDFKWSEEVKLHQLVSCLEGRALQIYLRSDREKRCSYKVLCEQLELAFSETAIEKARRFQTYNLDLRYETPEQNVEDLHEVFMAWFRAANPGREPTGENMINHNVREKLLEYYPDDLRVRIAQAGLYDAREIGVFAGKYFRAQQTQRALRDDRKQDKARELKCFICGSPKHIARYCKQRATGSAAVETGLAQPKSLPTANSTSSTGASKTKGKGAGAVPSKGNKKTATDKPTITI